MSGECCEQSRACGQPACTEPWTEWGYDALVSCPYEWKPNPKEGGKGLGERRHWLEGDDRVGE